jgi:hypothetical protein
LDDLRQGNVAHAGALASLAPRLRPSRQLRERDVRRSLQEQMRSVDPRDHETGPQVFEPRQRARRQEPITRRLLIEQLSALRIISVSEKHTRTQAAPAEVRDGYRVSGQRASELAGSALLRMRTVRNPE